MSGSKLLRLCCLFLSLLLLVPSFSVVANAEEADENLVSSDLSTWSDYSDIEDSCTPITRLAYDSTNNYSNILISAPITLGSYYTLYDISSLSLGDTYRISFNITEKHYSLAELFLNYFVVQIGLAYMDSDGNLLFDDGCWFELNANNVSNYVTTNNFDFKPTSIKGTPYIVIAIACIQSYDSTGNFGLSLQNFSLTKLPSDESVKLDGILGWLQDIKNTLIGLPETIKTNLSTFFTDLSTKLTELNNNIKTNLETLGNNINGKLGDVSTDFSDYVSGLGDRVSTFFSDLKTNLTSEFTDFKNKVNTEFTNLKSNLTTNFDNLRSTLSSRFDKVDNFLTEIRDFFHNLYWDLVGGTCGAGDVHSSLFERLGDRIRGFFEDLKVKIDIKVEEIKTAIHDFFVPPEGFFEEWKGNFDLMLSENLGFIYETPDLITGFVTLAKNILDTDTEPSIIFPEISFELPGDNGVEINLFEETEVDLTFLSESDVFSFLYYEAYPALLHVIFILALIGYAKYIWGRTMSN